MAQIGAIDTDFFSVRDLRRAGECDASLPPFRIDLFSVFSNRACFMGAFPIRRRAERGTRSTSQVHKFERNPRVFDASGGRENTVPAHLLAAGSYWGRNVSLCAVWELAVGALFFVLCFLSKIEGDQPCGECQRPRTKHKERGSTFLTPVCSWCSRNASNKLPLYLREMSCATACDDFRKS